MNKLSEGNLHPTVIEFKKFINSHPKLIVEIRRSGDSWQEYYEKWSLLGESDPTWEEFKTESLQAKKKHSDIYEQIIKLTDNIDLNKVQKQVHQFSNTINTIQAMLGEFIDRKPQAQKQAQPFNWFRD